MTENAEAEPAVLRLTWAEFKALPEYSHSLPTGKTAGKRWRRHAEWVDRKAAYAAHPGRQTLSYEECEPYLRMTLWIGEYGKSDGERIPITWYRPVIVCRSGEGL